MRRHALACARLVIDALWRRLCGRAWAVRPPAGDCRLPGLVRDGWIRRDEAGVPHVFADNPPDLGFAVGVAMAQDRLWQMETLRRLAFGRLAEVAGDRPIKNASLHLAGPSLLAVDQFYRSARVTRRLLELRNGILTGTLIVQAALANPVSIGCHYIEP